MLSIACIAISGPNQENIACFLGSDLGAKIFLPDGGNLAEHALLCIRLLSSAPRSALTLQPQRKKERVRSTCLSVRWPFRTNLENPAFPLANKMAFSAF